jgi:hypothetical protein
VDKNGVWGLKRYDLSLAAFAPVMTIGNLEIIIYSSESCIRGSPNIGDFDRLRSYPRNDGKAIYRLPYRSA